MIFFTKEGQLHQTYNCLKYFIPYTGVREKFGNIFVTFLLCYSSYNKSSLTFTIKAIVLHYLNPAFYQFFDNMLIPALLLRAKKTKHLHWNFFLILFVEALWAQEVSHGSQLVIIRGSHVRTIGWVLHQFNSFRFLEFIVSFF